MRRVFKKEFVSLTSRSDFCLQLRQEYGYDIDPNLPQFAERLAEKEKEYTLIQRQERKAMGRNSINFIIADILTLEPKKLDFP